MENKKERSRLKRQVAELVLTEIENFTGSGASPVTGEEFQALSDEYRKAKQKAGKGGNADLHFKDKMINAIKAVFKEDAVEFKITDSNEKKKAHNHNNGVTLPRRQFLPNDSKKTGKFSNFAPEIRKGIKDIFDGHKGND